MTTWCRLKYSDTWHHHPECQHRIKILAKSLSYFIVWKNKKPTTGEVCDQCRAKDRKARKGKKK